MIGGGKFHVEGEERSFRKVSLILGGSGITPGYQLLERVLRDKNDKTQIRVVDANKSEKDILLKDELEEMTKKSDGRIQVTHVLSHPSDEWKGLKGHVNEDIIKEHCFPPSGEGEEGGESAVFLCGPPAMIQKAALPALKGERSLTSVLLRDYWLMRLQIGAMRRTRIASASRFSHIILPHPH